MATVTRARRVALAAREALVADDADAADPGPPRLPLRHRPGARGLQGAEGTEAALRRRPRPRAGHLARERARRADLLGRGGEVVRPLPEAARRTASTRRSSSSVTTRTTARRRPTRRLPPTKIVVGHAARLDDDDRRERQGRPQRAHHRRPARDVRRLDGRRAATPARKNWDRLVAVLAVGTTPITAGGVKLSAASGTVTIKLMNQALRVAAGKKLTLYLALDVARAEPGERALSRVRAAGRADHDRPRHARTSRC